MLTQTAAIRSLVTHRDPDIDDVEAIRLLRKYGEPFYPGISQAKVVTTADRESFADSHGVLCIGIGGSEFDEHPFEGRARREGDCAATLVAKRLGLNEVIPLQANLKYAFDKNYNANTHEWELAPLVKLAFRHCTHTGLEINDQVVTDKIFRAAFMFLDMVEMNELSLINHSPLPGSATASMDEMVASWLQRKFGYDESIEESKAEAISRDKSICMLVAKKLAKIQDETLRFILQYGAQRRTAEIAGAQMNFQLAELVYLAQKHLCVGAESEASLKRIQRSVDVFLTAVWRKDTNFLVSCKADFEASTTREIALLKRGKDLIRIVSVESSNSEIAKYARSKHGSYSAVVVKREPSGNTQVFFDQRYKLDVAPVVAALRFAERSAKGFKQALSLEVMQAQGNNVYGAEEWYFDGHQIMNGSLTTNVPPTWLSREEVEDIVVRAVRRSMV